MKKQFYLLAACIFAATTILAQKAQVKDWTKERTSSFQSTSPKKVKQTKPEAKGDVEIFWEDDFSDPTLWDTYDESVAGEGGIASAWSIETDNTIAPFGALNPMALPSFDNGFAFINADAGLEGSTQNAWIEYTEPINLEDHPAVSIQFQQVTRNFMTTYFVQFSLDDGVIWQNAFDGDDPEDGINTDITGGTDSDNPDLYSLNVSNIVGGQSNVRLRFNYQANWGWFWAVDDVKFVAAPDFDLALRAAAYDKWLQVILEEPTSDLGVPEGDTPVQEYLDNLEYSEYQVGQVRPFTFVGDVVNLGASEMTNVIFEATVETPSGSEEFTSDPITLAPFTSSVITIEDVELAAFSGGGELGDYTVSFRVFGDQDEGDLIDNNTAPDRLFSVTEERTSNGSPTNESAGLFTDGTDNDFLNQFTVATETEVNYIQFSLSNGTTVINNYGEEVFLNIGEGAYYSEDDLVDFFPEDELTYEIEEAEVTLPGDEEVRWITMMLPEERTLLPGVTYYVNLTVPIPEIAGEDIAFVTLMDGQENTAGVYLSYDEADGPTNFVLEDLVPALRAGFVDVTGTRNFGHLNFSMEQNYPNPVADGSTRISWALTEAAENITFSITDNTGKTVYQKDLGDRPAGSQEDIVLDGLNFAAGIYQYGINIDNQRIVRKMMITE